MGKSLRHVTSSRKAFFGIDLLPMGLFNAAELLRRSFLSSKVFVTFDFPAVSAGLDEITGIGAMAPRRFADRTQLVLLFMRGQVFEGVVDFVGSPHPNTPVIVHRFSWRIRSRLMQDEN